MLFYDNEAGKNSAKVSKVLIRRELLGYGLDGVLLDFRWEIRGQKIRGVHDI